MLLVHPPPRTPAVASLTKLAQESAAQPARAEPPGSETLAAKVEGQRFPYLARRFGWFANGERTAKSEKRPLRVVYYSDGNRRLGYEIVAGPPFTVSGGTTISRARVHYTLLTVEGVRAVLWEQRGHTRLIGAHDVSDAELLALASWRGGASG